MQFPFPPLHSLELQFEGYMYVQEDEKNFTNICI